MKKDTWLKIENEFNSQIMENPRSATTLKNKYKNINRHVKKQYAEEKTFSQGTGGGPTKSFQKTSIASVVGSILQTKMTGESATYDSDYCSQSTPTVEADLTKNKIDCIDVIQHNSNIIDIFCDDIVNEQTTNGM